MLGAFDSLVLPLDFATMFSSGFSEGKALGASQSSTRMHRGETGHPDSDGDSQMSSVESDDDFAMYESSLESDGDEAEAGQEQPDGNEDNGHRDELEEAVEGDHDPIGENDGQEGDSDEDDDEEAEHTAHTSLLVSGAEDDETPTPSDVEPSSRVPTQRMQLSGGRTGDTSRYPGMSGTTAGMPVSGSRNETLLTPGTRSPSSANRPTTMRSSSTSGSGDDRRNLMREGSGTSATSNGTLKAIPGAKSSDQASKAHKDNRRKYIEVVVKDAT